jgi:hypothetical protein
MKQVSILNEEILRISEIMGISPKLITEQKWWKSIGKAGTKGASDVADFLSRATGALGRTIAKISDLSGPGDFLKVFKGSKGVMRELKDAFMDEVVTQLGKNRITFDAATFVNKTEAEVLQDLQKVGIHGDEAVTLINMFSKRFRGRPKKSTNVTPPVKTKKPDFGDVIDGGSKLTKKSPEDIVGLAESHAATKEIIKKGNNKKDLLDYLRKKYPNGGSEDEMIQDAIDQLKILKNEVPKTNRSLMAKYDDLTRTLLGANTPAWVRHTIPPLLILIGLGKFTAGDAFWKIVDQTKTTEQLEKERKEKEEKEKEEKPKEKENNNLPKKKKVKI